ncbi:MAG: hypothetical protein IH616_10605 [Gemmatimonadales bacterium]|jgi:hypothetical protein|nr:hypothetical protein [Gemmatimonadales bacterium]
MTFTAIPTEQTTALTDLVLAVVALLCAAVLRMARRYDAWKVRLWTWVFVLLAVAALLGTVAHGLDLTDQTRAHVWRPLYLALGLVVALFALAAVRDWWGEGRARRLAPLAVWLGIGFFIVTQLGSGTFLIFVAYEAVATLFALIVYAALAVRRQLPGAGIVAAGILLNLIAAAVQASDAVGVSVAGVPLDHNGVFHLVQIVAVIVLTVGLRRGLAAATVRSHR